MSKSVYKQHDEISKAFCNTYGIRNLLEEFGFRKIKKQGDFWMCCCPFHQERDASFGIHNELGYYRCFACQEHGNIYMFIQNIFAIPYENAIQFVQSHSGIGDDEQIADYRLLRDLNNLLDAPIVESSEPLEKISDEDLTRIYVSKDPYNYLQKRGFSEETIEDFQCGYVAKWSEKRPFPRIVIPAFDEHETAVGLIGRTPIDEEPKYLYPYQFPKQDILFNLNSAKNYSERGIILVEGPLDAMQVHNYGFPNVCAILGAYLSDRQIQLLRKYTDKVFLGFDNDAAGKNAVVQGSNKLHQNFDVSIIKWGKYKDPGEIEDRNILKKKITNSVHLDNYMITKKLLEALQL